MSLLVSNITSIISSSTPLPNLIAIFGSSTKEESLIVVASMEHPFPQSRLFDYFTQPRFARFLSPPPPRARTSTRDRRARSFTSWSKTDKIKVPESRSRHIIGKWSIPIRAPYTEMGEGGEQELIRNGRTTVNYSYPGQNPLPPPSVDLSLLPRMASTPRKPRSFYSISPLSLLLLPHLPMDRDAST